MVIKNNVPIKSISWLKYCDSGIISVYYEPESKEELTDLCKKMYQKGEPFEIIGYTSNIYFTHGYNVDNIVSTRRVKEIEFYDDYIVVDCGFSVKTLARQMVDKGIVGFEGLIDLPGTIGAAIYGNASCYNCSINKLLISLEFLNDKGKIIELKLEDLKLGIRSSILKRGELHGVILSARLRCIKNDSLEIKKNAEQYCEERKRTQPGPANNLGSIFRNQGKPTAYYYIMSIISVICSYLSLIFHGSKENVKVKKKVIFFYLIGAKDLLPYVYNWNRFIWLDESSHKMFEKFLKIHKRLFTGNELEIEIK